MCLSCVMSLVTSRVIPQWSTESAGPGSVQLSSCPTRGPLLWVTSIPNRAPWFWTSWTLESPRTNGPFRRDGQMERCHEQTLDNEEVVVLACSADDLFYLTSPALQTQHPAPFTMIKQRERGKRREGRGVWWGDRKRGGSELGPYFNSTQLPNLICYSTTYHCCLDRLTALQLQPTALIHNNHHPLLTTLVITVICFLHFL